MSLMIAAALSLSNASSHADSAAVSEPLHAGTAKVDITPTGDAILDILGKPLQRRDPIFARIVVLKHGDVSVAIVSLDLILFASPRIVKAAKEKWNVDHVILNSTHSHATPLPDALRIAPTPKKDWTRGNPDKMLDIGKLSDDPWQAEVEEKIIATIGEAANSLFPARIASTRAPFESLYMAHNRRYVGPDGKVRMLWANPDRIPTKPLDPTIGVIRIEDMQGKPRALLVHYACHPVITIGLEFISRDFPGAMVDHVEQELGESCMAMFLQGASGDIDPYECGLKGDYALNIVQQAGKSLGKAALRVSETMKIDPNRKPSLKTLQTSLTIPHRNGNDTSEAGILTVVINDSLALVTNGGEPFVQHQIDLAAQSPVRDTLLLGLTYTGVGSPFLMYIPTVQAVKEGGYGTTECSFLAADAGERIVAEAVAGIRKLLEPAGSSPHP